MKLMMDAQNMLIQDEGYEEYPYNDATSERIRLEKGNVTIGVGHNLEEPLSIDTIMFMLSKDIEQAIEDVQDLISRPIWETLSHGRKLALINMSFNLGAYRLGKFHKMIAAIRRYQFHVAAREALDSKWAEQVGSRAKRVAEMLRTGEYTDKN
jgi:lysozyme